MVRRGRWWRQLHRLRVFTNHAATGHAAGNLWVAHPLDAGLAILMGFKHFATAQGIALKFIKLCAMVAGTFALALLMPCSGSLMLRRGSVWTLLALVLWLVPMVVRLGFGRRVSVGMWMGDLRACRCRWRRLGLRPTHRQ